MTRDLPTHDQHWHPIDVRGVPMQVQEAAEQPHTIDAGGAYVVEPGDTHTETALVDTLLLVICGEDRPECRR